MHDQRFDNRHLRSCAAIISGLQAARLRAVDVAWPSNFSTIGRFAFSQACARLVTP